MQRRATPSRSQKEAISRAGYNPMVWTVLKDLDRRLIIRNRLTGTVKVINKKEEKS